MSNADTQPQLPLKPEQLRRLTAEQLARVAAEIGLDLPTDISDDEALQRVSQRQALIARFDRPVLEELLIWGGRVVMSNAGKYHVAGEVSRISKMRFSGLSDRALYALAGLRDAPLPDEPDRDDIIAALKGQESLLGRLTRKRRQLVGKFVAKLIGETHDEVTSDQPPSGGIKEQIEQRGLVGGLADKLRGAADDYVAVKLDEIERRIDSKLDDIDKRLAEWRDREIANRLRIIKITLAASVIIALVSVAYAWLKIKLF